LKKYITGYYCPEEYDLDILSKRSNLDILDALEDAYPDALTATELANKTGLPIKTIYAQLTELFRGYFINEIDNRKLPQSRGRPKTNSHSQSSQRKSSSVVIENANSLFDLYNGKKKTPLPPGNVVYSEDFIKTISSILDPHDQNEINKIILQKISKIFRFTVESKDNDIKSIAPSTEEDYCCSQCGLNHEARDFIRAVLLYMIDQFEHSKDFIKFLKENKLLTLDAYENASKKIDINFEMKMGLENDSTNITNNSIVNNKSNDLSISKNSYEYERDVKKIKNHNTEDQSFAKEDIYEKKIKLLLDGKIDEFNELREKDNFQFLDLSEADLSRTNLSAANLSGANLERVNLSGANLSGTNLIGANLSGANLSPSYLIGANLSGANLKEANLSAANLSAANLSSSYLKEANLSAANLKEANLSGADLSGTNLSGTNLSGTNLENIMLLRTDLSDADLFRANLSSSHLIGANLSGANLSVTTLFRTDLKRANLSDSIIIHPINYNSLIIDEKTDFNNGIIDNGNFIDYIFEFTKNIPEKVKDKKELKTKLKENLRISEKYIERLLKISQLPD
jgi:uncharacterized protein YjbI with pentapeptide repeats